MKLAFLFPVMLFCAASARASVADDLLDQLKAEVKTEARAAKETGDAGGQQQLIRMEEVLAQIEEASHADGGDDTLLRSVEALGNFTLSEKTAKLCKELAMELRASQEKRDRALQEEMTKTFTDALHTALAAKSAKDIDGPLAAVAKLTEENENRNTRDPGLRRLLNESRKLREFLPLWQDYLSASEAGNVSEARQKLQNLAGYGRDFSAFIPRSELLSKINALPGPEKPSKGQLNSADARIERLKAVQDIVASIGKLDDVRGALAQIEGLPTDPNGVLVPALASLISQLRTISFTYDELKEGLATSLNVSSLTGSSFNEQTEILAPLRQKLLLFALPRILGLPENEAPHPEENAATYLQRLLTVAKSKEDWSLVRRIAELAESLKLNAVAETNDNTALHSFLGGLNQEHAGQLSLAVVSYQAALKTGSQVVSPEIIGAHLAAIKKSSPEEFEKGMQLTLNPPADSRYPSDPRFFGRPFPPGYPYPGRAETSAPAAIEVPGKAVPPVAPAAPAAPALPPAK